MYITTFYSFKGGVGRTMALVNVAVDLARRGRRVLVVDFDLEAPGLDTFDLPRPDTPKLGVVDFVRDYLQTSRAPDASKYLYKAPGIGSGDGDLWIMPSGAPQETYARKLAEIDWNDLYEKHDGYLLFEDLKLQWKTSINPEYVFIDSRTGHTEVGGICTRQLPDAVVILFFPNEQNLRGLTKVVQDIRAERAGPRKKATELHFVMSNVPDIDDEDLILAKMMGSFQEQLGLSDGPLEIHRYQSLSLLNQVIFTVDRPNSRLAKEYRRLLETIIRKNPRDRNSASQYIKSLSRSYDPMRGDELDDDDINQLNEIRKNHIDDPEVLFQLGEFMHHAGESDEAMTLYNLSIKAGNSSHQVYFSRMNLWDGIFEDTEGAAHEALNCLNFQDLSQEEILEALETLTLSAKHLKKVLGLPAIRSLTPEDQICIAKQLNRTLKQAEVAQDLLLSIVSTRGSSKKHKAIAILALVSPSMALGKFSNAIENITAQEPQVDKMSIENAFSLGMAKWGATNSIVPELFDRSLEQIGFVAENALSPDSAQRIAIAHWALGQRTEATEAVDSIVRATNAVDSIVQEEGTLAWSSQFSYWRYLRVSASQFQEDIEELNSLIDGDESIRPRFMLAENDSKVGTRRSTDQEEG